MDFAHVCTLFLGHNDKILKQKSTIHQRKFNNLLKDKKLQHDQASNQEFFRAGEFSWN